MDTPHTPEIDQGTTLILALHKLAVREMAPLLTAVEAERVCAAIGTRGLLIKMLAPDASTKIQMGLQLLTGDITARAHKVESTVASGAYQGPDRRRVAQ